jgi:hypothetical protein
VKFFAFEVGWAKVAFDTIFPGAHAAGLVSMDAMDVDGFVHETAAHVPAKAAIGFRIAIWIATFAPLFVLRRFSTLGRLERGARETVLRALLASDSYAIRSLTLVLKTIGALLYAGDASVRGRMHAKGTVPEGADAPSGDRLVPLRLARSHAA